MNLAEMKFYEESSRKCKIEAEQKLRQLIQTKVGNFENQQMVLNFILENKMEIRNLIRNLVG